MCEMVRGHLCVILCDICVTNKERAPEIAAPAAAADAGAGFESKG